MSSIASLPLLDHNTVNAAQLNLTALANASAAFKAGKLPTSEQLQTAVQKLLASNFLQPELGSHYAGRVGGGKLSGPGREVVVRAREVLEAISNLAVKKNQDDKVSSSDTGLNSSTKPRNVDRSNVSFIAHRKALLTPTVSSVSFHPPLTLLVMQS